MTADEEHIAFVIKQAFDEWDSVHAGGWNEAYMKLVPTAFHQAAMAVCAHLAPAVRKHLAKTGPAAEL